MPEKMGSWAKLVAGAALGAAMNESVVRAEEVPQTPEVTLKKTPSKSPEEIAQALIMDAEKNNYVQRGSLDAPNLDKGGYMVGARPLPLTADQQRAIKPLLTYQRETCLMIPQGTIESMDPQKKVITIKTFNGQKIIYQPPDTHFFEQFKAGEKIGYKIVFRGNKERPVEFICRLPFITYANPAAEPHQATIAREQSVSLDASASETITYVLVPKPADPTKPGDQALWILERLYGAQPTIPPLRMSNKAINALSEQDARRDPGIHHNKVIPPLRGPGDKPKPTAQKLKK